MQHDGTSRRCPRDHEAAGRERMAAPVRDRLRQLPQTAPQRLSRTGVGGGVDRASNLVEHHSPVWPPVSPPPPFGGPERSTAASMMKPMRHSWRQSSDGFDLRQARWTRTLPSMARLNRAGHCPILQPWSCSNGFPPASSNRACRRRRCDRLPARSGFMKSSTLRRDGARPADAIGPQGSSPWPLPLMRSVPDRSERYAT